MKRNIIIFGQQETGIQKKAVAVLSEYLLDYTYDYPACYRYDQAFTRENSRYFYIGTRTNNPYIKEVCGEALTHPEEYRIQVQNDTVFIEGFDDRGVLYGCIDFFDKYIIKCEYPHNDHYRINCFEKELPDYETTSYPSVKNRGLWTWGHVIYNYKGYIDNMVKLKLNVVTIWNDCAPVNAKEIVAYAHDCGIKVIWGYSWLWNTNCNQIPLDTLDAFSQDIFDQYEREYSHLDGDGIYFQSVTETYVETQDGIVIADAVTRFVNKTAALFFAKYPNLELQFGLHATSVKKNLAYIQQTDPRIHIIWEDLGAFPFSYIPNDIETFEDTKTFINQISHLRGEKERFGVVTKGLTKLDWYSFEHPDAPRYIGVCSKAMKVDRVARKHKIWKYLQAFWLTNGDKALEMIRFMKDLRNGDLYVSGLVEDGMFEENVMYPVALFAEMLWDADCDIKNLMSDVALRSYVEFA